MNIVFDNIGGRSVVVDLEKDTVTVDDIPVNGEAVKDVIVALMQEKLRYRVETI